MAHDPAADQHFDFEDTLVSNPRTDAGLAVAGTPVEGAFEMAEDANHPPVPKYARQQPVLCHDSEGLSETSAIFHTVDAFEAYQLNSDAGCGCEDCRLETVDLSEQMFLGNDPDEKEIGTLIEKATAVLSGEVPKYLMDGNPNREPQLMALAKTGVAALQELAGMAAERKGFHEDRPVSGQELLNWQGNKLMLIVSELVEAHDEIRSGHAAYETRYLDNDGAAYQVQEHDFNKAPMFKPEGVPSEIADVVIRAMDLAWTEGFDLSDIIIEKLEYNATRGYKHGRLF